MLSTTADTLKAWETLQSDLSLLYREVARESAAGYERAESKAEMERLEKAEHEAWLAYRAAEDADNAVLLAYEA